MSRCDKTLDFEDPRQRNCFVSSRGSISLSTLKAKNGAASLKLESDASGTSEFRYARPSGSYIQGTDLLRGGIKMWIYKTTAVIGRAMEVRLIDTIRSTRSRVGTFNVDMAYEGWRGIWVSYDECKERRDSLNRRAKITRVDFVFNHHDTIYIDLLELVPNLAFQSRDKIVPPFTTFGSKYDYRDFWQQSYRWSQKRPFPSSATINASKSLSIAHIENRLRNWYCDETTTTYDFIGPLEQRWNTLKKSIDKAQNEYDRLDFNPSGTVITGPPLFCLKCTRGSTMYSSTIHTRKFSFVMTNILQPLAIELHLKSRPDEITRTLTEETPKLKLRRNRKALVRICGKNTARQNEFHNHLKSQSKPYTEAKVRLSLQHINQARLQRIFNVLDYLKDQGWADGSALGSLYMEMLRSSAGFIHSLFLLKDTLATTPAYKTRLINLINAAKWYHDFGEVYQSPFEYKGTTADFMITRMLSRLIIVLAMPTDTAAEQEARQRDMDALNKWMENALTINTALGGVIKPDYTGFHHATFYGSAYVPDALHTVAQVQYLIEGTNFELSAQAKHNLQKSLQNLRITAVKYSTPSSVAGRFPDYSQAVLASDLPAYAYISVSYPGSLPPTPAKGIHISDLNSNAGMFERLYEPSNVVVAKNLASGWIKAGKSYFNTLGSLQLMNKVSS